MIEARGLSRRFGPVVALDDVSIRVEEGELVALLGPSGSGKTTLLRVLAGLEEADAGEVRVDGRDAAGLGVRERGMAFVFQQHALFRHMTVLENVAFGLRVLPRRARPSEAAIREKVRELLALVRLDGLEGRLPEQLSGGQRQRVALARALAVEPRALLLDEPFASLDARVRRDLRAWLRAVHDELHVTSVFVTHDQEEALEIADRVVVLRAGRVEQVGPPEEVLDRPRTAFVHEFFGDANALDGEVRGGAVELGGGLTARCPGRADGERVRVLVRAWDLELEPSQGDGGARVRRVSAVGDHARIELELAGGARLTAHAPRRGAPVPAVGAAVRLRAREAHVYPAEALTPAAVAGRAEGVPEALAAEPALPGGAVG